MFLIEIGKITRGNVLYLCYKTSNIIMFYETKWRDESNKYNMIAISL